MHARESDDVRLPDSPRTKQVHRDRRSRGQVSREVVLQRCDDVFATDMTAEEVGVNIMRHTCYVTDLLYNNSVCFLSPATPRLTQ